jgi:prepilin-type N-terminal cleavage/methylation domain-containing protein
MDAADQDGRLLMMRRRVVGRRRRALSLIEVLAAVVIFAILVSIITPVVNSRLTIAHIENLETEMQTYVQGIELYQRDVGKYPARLDYLDQLPSSGIVDACGNALTAQNQAKFRGPYINRIIALPNLATGKTRFSIATDDTVDAVITRTTVLTTGGGTQQVLQITILGPDRNVATMVDSTTDGTVDGTAGTVRYASLSASNNTILWTLPIKNGAC